MKNRRATDRKTSTVEHTLDSLARLERYFAVEKRKTAILFADLVGSTPYKRRRGLVVGLYKTRRHNSAVTEGLSERRGRVVKYLGDGVLARFDGPTSCSRAINAAIAINERFAKENTGVVDPFERIETRIGIAFGPVADFYNGDPQGPTVDLAARIQSFAKPNQILVHADVLTQRGGAISSKVGRLNQWPASDYYGRPTVVDLKGVPDPQSVVEIRWSTDFEGLERQTATDTWEDLQYNATLFPLEGFPDDVTSEYFGISFDLKYRAVLRAHTLRFAVVNSSEQLNAAMKDTMLFSRYMLPITPILRSVPSASLFDVAFLTINDAKIPMRLGPSPIWPGSYLTQTFEADSLIPLVDKRVTFHYQTRTVIAKRGNFFAMLTESSVHGLAMTFDTAAVALRRVKAIDYFAARSQPRFVYTPNPQKPKKIELHLSEQIPSRGGVIFVWDVLGKKQSAPHQGRARRRKVGTGAPIREPA